MNFRPVAVILAAISATGAIAIPIGNPMFLERAIIIELSFITLAVLAFLGKKKILYICIPLAAIVVAGNSLAPPHVELMTTFSKPFNAVILIVGGYVLQVALIIASVLEIIRGRKTIKPEIKKD